MRRRKKIVIRTKLLAWSFPLLLLMAACAAEEETTATEEETAEFDAAAHFSGETVRVLVGFSPGGGFDTYARLLADHIGQYIPGNPSIVVENLTGAGGLVLAAHMVEEAEPDGLTVATMGNYALANAIGDPGVPVDITELEFIGDVFPEPAGCLFRSEVGEDLRNLDVDSLNLADVSARVLGGLVAPLLEEHFDVEVNLITGYEGSGEIQLAVEQGEADGYCSSIGSMLRDSQDMRAAGRANILTYVGAEPLGEVFEETPDALWLPALVEDVSGPEAAEEVALLITAARGYHKHFTLPPETPFEIVNVWREALAQVVEDENFLADAEAQGRPIFYVSGEELERRVMVAPNLPEELLEYARNIMLE